MEGAPAWHKAGRCGQKVNCPRGAREAALGRRPLPGGGGTQRPGWAVKRRSRPLPRDESACFRGATHVQSGIPLPLSFCCGKGTAPVSGPAGGAVFSGAVSVRSFQPRDLSLSGGVPDTHAPSWRWTLSAARAGAGRGNGENVSLRWRRGCGWGSSPRASPSLPGPDRGSAAQRWPRWWPWGRSAGHTAWRWTARCRPALRSGGR